MRTIGPKGLLKQGAELWGRERLECLGEKSRTSTRDSRLDSCQEFHQAYRQAVDVSSRRIAFSLPYLRGHVTLGSYDALEMGDTYIVLVRDSQAKIAQECLAFPIQEKIGWLYVPVQDPLLVQKSQGAGDTGSYLKDLGEWEKLSGKTVPVCIPPGIEGEDEKGMWWLQVGSQNWYQRFVAEGLSETCLALKTLAQGGTGIRGEHLESDGLSTLGILGLIDGP
jgi:hypothetical protein